MKTHDMPEEAKKYIADMGDSWKIIDTRYDGEDDCPEDEKWERWEIVAYNFLKGSVYVKVFYIDNWCNGRQVSEFSNEIFVCDMKRWLHRVEAHKGVA